MPSMSPPKLCTMIAAAGLAIAASPALATPEIEVIFTKIAGHPTSIVPGAVDPSGAPVVTEFRAMEDLVLSPDGSRWVIKGRNQMATESDTMLLMGSGLNGEVFAQEARPIPGGAAGEVFDFFGSGTGRFNSLNQFAYSARARGGAASTFQKVLVWSPPPTSTHILAFQMGDLINGLQTTGGVPGAGFFGNSVGSIHILNDGVIGSQDSTITGISSLYRPAIMYDNNAFLQNRNETHTFLGLDGITVERFGPQLSGIGGGPAANSFYTAADGTGYIVRGGLADYPSSLHQALIVSGRVMAQQGRELPGTTLIVNTIIDGDMAENGDWVARGTIDGGGVWAMYNGTVVAFTGSPVTPGGGEVWGDSFASIHCNAVGDWVLVGNTNLGPAIDAVVVVNGQFILLREGDEVNLTGPGITSGVFIGQGNNTLAAFASNMTKIGNDRMVYFVANIRDGLGNNYNLANFGSPNALMRKSAGEPPVGPCYANCDGSTIQPILNVDDFTCFINEFAQAQTLPQHQQITAYANCDGSTIAPVLNVDDFTCFINEFAQGCP
jgi:hypothetical protein